jgi:hypothetical protein
MAFRQNAENYLDFPPMPSRGIGQYLSRKTYTISIIYCRVLTEITILYIR